MTPAVGSCPDWAALVAARDAGHDGDETAWRRALAHLDACGGCRRRALAADPALLFQALPKVPVAASEAAAMRQAVASMRRARRVAPGPLAGRIARARARVPALGRRARGLAAAALLAAVTGGVWLGLPAAGRATSAGGPSSAAAGEAPATGPVAPLDAAPSPAEPVFMDLSRPRSADVYRVGNGGLQVVMVVDERLDV